MDNCIPKWNPDDKRTTFAELFLLEEKGTAKHLKDWKNCQELLSVVKNSESSFIASQNLSNLENI